MGCTAGRQIVAKKPENLKTLPQDLREKYKNKSDAIRGLHAEGMKPADIAKLLGIRYQHAWNVISRPEKRKIKKERERERNAPTEETPAADTSAELAMRHTPRLVPYRPSDADTDDKDKGDS